MGGPNVNVDCPVVDNVCGVDDKSGPNAIADDGGCDDYPRPCGWRVQYLVCVCVSVNTKFCISRSKQAGTLRLDTPPRQNVILYKTGSFYR